jgi:hypothetical protein
MCPSRLHPVLFLWGWTAAFLYNAKCDEGTGTGMQPIQSPPPADISLTLRWTPPTACVRTYYMKRNIFRSVSLWIDDRRAANLVAIRDRRRTSEKDEITTQSRSLLLSDDFWFDRFRTMCRTRIALGHCLHRFTLWRAIMICDPTIFRPILRDSNCISTLIINYEI